MLERYYAERDPGDRDELISRFLPLARRHAARYARPGGEPLDDLFQVASLALVKAIDRFDPSRGVPFVSYASPTILGELKRHFRDTSWAVHVPRGLQESVLAVERAADDLFGRLGRSATVAEIAEATGIELETVLDALATGRAVQTRSLDRPVEDEDGDRTLGDTIGTRDTGFELAEYGADIQSTIATFSERDRRVLHLRFVEDLTQSQIGVAVGISQMHVSRILRRLLNELRAAAAGSEH